MFISVLLCFVFYILVQKSFLFETYLNGDIHGGGAEGLKHDLGHLLPVGLGVEGRLSEQDGVLLGGDAQLVVEGVVPDLLHVVPVGDDAVLDGILEGEHAPLGLGLVAHVEVPVAHAHHDALVAGPTCVQQVSREPVFQIGGGGGNGVKAMFKAKIILVMED